MAESPVTPAPGSTFRFVVRSADEAVRMIHEKLGPTARVVSVRQIGGLAGLLRSPQLEVIAEIPASEPPPPPAAPPAAPAPAVAPPVFQLPETEVAPTEPLDRMLARAGLSEQMRLRLAADDAWETLRRRPLGDALKQVVELLRTRWQQREQRSPGQRVVFFGPPGCGATTALCKALAMDVFFRQQPAVVLKLDHEQPNPSEGLAMFCEALDIPLLRSADELDDAAKTARVYFDSAGFPLGDAAGWRNLGRLFGEFYIDTRVLVINAAYETSLIKRSYALAVEAGATHVVFSHLDELQHWGKLWEPLLLGELHPLFFSNGQNVSGDVSENIFDLVAERTFGTALPARRAAGMSA